MSHVYFMRSGKDGPIKIGIAKDIEKRRATLQTGNPEPISLIASFGGGQDVETRLHEAFAAHRLSGEWFSGEAALVEAAIHLNEAGEMKETSTEFLAMAVRRDLMLWDIAEKLDDLRLHREGQKPKFVKYADIAKDSERLQRMGSLADAVRNQLRGLAYRIVAARGPRGLHEVFDAVCEMDDGLTSALEYAWEGIADIYG